MAWWMAIPAIVSAASSLYGMLKSKPEKYKTTSQFDNPYVQQALRRMDLVSQHGYKPEILSIMKRNIAQQTGQEASALRSSAQQRMMQRNAPIQIQEQNLRDLATQTMGQRAMAISNVDVQNEQTKMDALRSILGAAGAMGQTTTQEQPGGGGFGELFGSSLGQLGNLLMMMKQGGQGQKYDYNPSSNFPRYDPDAFKNYQFNTKLSGW